MLLQRGSSRHSSKGGASPPTLIFWCLITSESPNMGNGASYLPNEIDEATARSLCGPLFDRELFTSMADERGIVSKEKMLEIATPEDMKLEAERRAAILLSEEVISEKEKTVKKLEREEAIAIDNLEQMEMDTTLRDEVAALMEEKNRHEEQLEGIDEDSARKLYLKVKESLNSVVKHLKARERALEKEIAVKAQLRQKQDLATERRVLCEEAIADRKVVLREDIRAQMQSGGARLIRVIKPHVKEKNLNWDMNRVFVKSKVTDVPWDGVIFDNHGEIASISLMSCGVDIDIDIFCTFFCHTSKLDLSGNDDVRGDIKCLRKFVHLGYLDLGYTGVYGDISCFKEDAELRSVKLEKKIVSNQRRIEDAKIDLQKTRKLMQETPPDTDSYRELEHDVADSLAEIDELSEDTRKAELKIHEACPPLTVLDLQCTDITGTLESLYRNVKLERLLMNNTAVMGSIDTFRHCHNLKEVRLAQNNITGSIQVFGSCRSLETCDLRCTRVNGSKKSLENELPFLGGRVFL